MSSPNWISTPHEAPPEPLTLLFSSLPGATTPQQTHNLAPQTLPRHKQAGNNDRLDCFSRRPLHDEAPRETLLAATLRPEARNPKCRVALSGSLRPSLVGRCCGMTTGAAAAAAAGCGPTRRESGEMERRRAWFGGFTGHPPSSQSLRCPETSLGHQPGGRMSSSKTLRVEN